MMRSLDIGCKDILRLCQGTHLIRTCPVAICKVKVVVSRDIHAVACIVRLTTHVHIIPLYLVIVKREVNLSMHAQIEIVDGIEPLLDGTDIGSFLTVSHHLLIELAFGATIRILQVGSEYHSKLFIPKTIADRDACMDIGHWYFTA